MNRLPSKLKKMNIFNAGNSYLGETAGVTLPPLKRLMEPWRGGGMDGAVKVDMGQDEIVLEHKYGGYIPQVLEQYGEASVDGAMLRFIGAYQSDQDGTVKTAEIVVRGRHEEIERGEAKVGEDTELTVKTTCSYYKESIDGRVLVEIDLLNMVFVVNGVDRLAAQRAALGLGGFQGLI